MKCQSEDEQTLEQKNYGAETLTNVVNSMDVSLSGLKHAHETKSSYSNKEQVFVKQSEEGASKQLIVAGPL